MNHKIVVQLALLAVLGASVGAWAWNSFARHLPAAPSMPASVATPNGSADGTPATPTRPAAAPPVASAAAEVLADGVAVINFHGTRR